MYEYVRSDNKIFLNNILNLSNDLLLSKIIPWNVLIMEQFSQYLIPFNKEVIGKNVRAPNLEK